MAEQTTEHGDDLAEGTPGYKPPAQKTLSEIMTTDAEDEALIRYKQQLLGTVSGAIKCAFPDDSRNVIVKELAFRAEGRDDIKLNLLDASGLKNKKFVIKEGCTYQVAVSFYVQREIVSGLIYLQDTYRKGIKVDKEKFMVGSYGPKTDAHTYLTPKDEAPKGMLSRGSYTVKSKFTDDDKNLILGWDWEFKIEKDWKESND